METIILGLLLLAAVLVSAVIDQLVPKISLPLIQIAMGLVIAIFAPSSIDIELDPGVFLVFFIAPLLYNEAKNTNKSLLWRDIRPILSLAIGLVIVTALIIGVVVHSVIPSITLAAAFALGGALGPTDAVAVSSLSDRVDIPERQKSVLKGELLLNDASGIVVFQFAIAAAITGEFSFGEAVGDFCFDFFGGLICGAVLGFLFNFIIRRIRAIGVENITFHVLFEVCMPFLIYLIADAINVSGVIAVVVAGLINVISPRMVGPSISRMNIVSSNVWEVLTFALNGIVFVLLGTQLPGAMSQTWGDVSINNGLLILFILLITFVLLGVRYIWTLGMELVHVHRGEKRKFRGSDAKAALITTLSGAKGTITLSILFTIPVYAAAGEMFPQRNLIIFLACGVIVCTLLISTFIVPLLAPKRDLKESEIEKGTHDVECSVEILRNVIEELNAHRTPENRRETQIVIKAYNDRIARLKEDNDIPDEPNAELRLKVLQWEKDITLELMDKDEVSALVGYQYLSRIEQAENLLQHIDGKVSFKQFWIRIKAVFRRGLRRLIHELPHNTKEEQREETRKLQILAYTYVVQKLGEMVKSNEAQTEDVTSVLLEYQRALSSLNTDRSVSKTIDTVDRSNDIKRYAYEYELEQIQTMYEEERLSRTAARKMRENVHLMQLDLDAGL